MGLTVSVVFTHHENANLVPARSILFMVSIAWNARSDPARSSDIRLSISARGTICQETPSGP